MSDTLTIATNHVEWTDVGIRYCLTHAGTQNEDEDGDCSWRYGLVPDKTWPCVFVELAYDASLRDMAQMLAGLTVLLATEAEAW